MRNGLLKITAFRMGEALLLFLLGFYFGVATFCPGIWSAVFDAIPKIYKRSLNFTASGAAVLGLLLFEWARRDAFINARCVWGRMVESMRSRSVAWSLGLFSGFGLWWAVSSCLRLEAMDAGFDMAIFTQAIWNTTQGDWFYSSIKGGISLLGDHFAPILAVFAIPYRVWPHPEFLLGMQALAAASCVFPLARFVRKTGQSPAWAILCCICFALYSPVRNSVRFDFHPEVLAMPLLFWAFCFLEEKRTLLSSVFLALALAAKENIATVAFAFGVYACLKKDRSLGFGAFWIVFSAVYFYAVVHWIIPVLSGAPYFYLSGNFTEWLCLGWKPLSRHVINVTTLSYVAKVYGPLAFTSFFAPLQLMLTLPTLAQNILSRSITTRSLYFQYTATLTPFVFIASVAAMAKIRKFRRYWAYLILLTSVFLSGVSEAYPIRRNWIAITPHTVMVREKLRSLPAEASLRTHEFYAPHAANRKELHIFENDHPKEGGSWKARHTDLVAIDRGLLKGSPEAALDELRASGYAVSFEQDGFYILKRAANSRQ